MPSMDRRPWGHFEVLSERADHKVKRIVVLPGQRLSLQCHRRREEHWFVVSGEATVTVGDADLRLVAGDAIDIPCGTLHRVFNHAAAELVFIEVQRGDYLGEDDIERSEDDYGRT
jgi:mannose-6-phosphate isomerase